jgi:DMSO/TMAO reductase YedYZ molybdopterin-dependent catalytic subunit
MTQHISRRYFLRLAALSGASAILTACGASLSPTVTPNTPASPTPPSNAATPIPGTTAISNATPTLEPPLSASTLQATVPVYNPTPCSLARIIAPTEPATIPGYTDLDPATNLHMTGTVQNIDVATFRLSVTGLVDQPLSLTLDELRCMPKVTAKITSTCPGFFSDTATWSGVPLTYVLGMAGVQKGATVVFLNSPDGHESYNALEDALKEDNFLAYEWEGQPLPILHGFPLRAILPGVDGNQSTKWLTEIKVQAS